MKKVIQMDLFANPNCRGCKGEGVFYKNILTGEKETFDCICSQVYLFNSYPAKRKEK